MRKASRFLGVFLFLLTLFSTCVSASAAGSEIFFTDDADKGCFSVEYSAAGSQKMKVGVAHSAGTVYYDYKPGTRATYTFTKGDGSYTVSLYRNVSGTTYCQVASRSVDVTIADALSIYRVSTTEITFSADDGVGKKAAELCRGKASDTEKVLAIHNYIASTFRYDDAFAADVSSGRVRCYTPDTNAVLEAKKGVCYDFSALFAAMCRSQGIACKLEKGYLSSGYHAWNSVYLNGSWSTVDLTRSIAKQITAAEKLSDCTVQIGEAA